MSQEKNSLNRNSALVYAGAAFLIVVVGIRTLLQTMDDGLTFIGYITIFALGTEFTLLLLYAWTIYKQPAEENSTAPVKSTPLQLPGLENQAKQIIEIGQTHQQLSQQLMKQNLANLKDIQKVNAEFSQNIANYLNQVKRTLNQMEKMNQG